MNYCALKIGRCWYPQYSEYNEAKIVVNNVDFLRTIQPKGVPQTSENSVIHLNCDTQSGLLRKIEKSDTICRFAYIPNCIVSRLFKRGWNTFDPPLYMIFTDSVNYSTIKCLVQTELKLNEKLQSDLLRGFIEDKVKQLRVLYGFYITWCWVSVYRDLLFAPKDALLYDKNYSYIKFMNEFLYK